MTMTCMSIQFYLVPGYRFQIISKSPSNPCTKGNQEETYVKSDMKVLRYAISYTCKILSCFVVVINPFYSVYTV